MPRKLGSLRDFLYLYIKVFNLYEKCKYACKNINIKMKKGINGKK
jgi:hypothetical protein